MNIIHYALGFPPYRSGGLTKYCFDLMTIQKELGHEIGLLWPGRMKSKSNKSYIKVGNDVEGVHNYELCNSLPVSLDEGVSDFEEYTASRNIHACRSFLEEKCPDVLHIHTLMGLPKELVVATKELGIRVVFTTHDYYGICPKVTLFQDGHCCDEDNNCRNCVKCNQTALSLNKIKILQSPLYRFVKDNTLVKALRRKHRSVFFKEELLPEPDLSKEEWDIKIKGYQYLRDYYISILSLVDVIHFNSKLAEMIYCRYIKPKESHVISITHRGIDDNRKIKKFNSEKLIISFLAPAKPYKGFNILIEALDSLWYDGIQKFELHIYSMTDKIAPYLVVKDGYTYSELGSILDKTDLLVAPSVWYETFGFTVLEAISYGVPVLVSENVGAKDIVIKLKAGDIFSPNAESLKESLGRVINDCSLLKQYNYNICSYKEFPYSQHDTMIGSLYDG